MVRPYGTNGLNQLTSAGASALGYDGQGNLTSDGTLSYGYTSENRLATASNGTALTYDPTGRLSRIVKGALTTRFEYLGPRLIAERDAGGTILRRYVHGPGEDEPLLWYEGSGLGDRRWLHADERGSVIAISDASGNAINLNAYDEYGVPAPTNLGRFQYTGQTWLPELSLYYYKARIYSPTLGRFMQTDPIGYKDGINWYAYVGNDPVNGIDPSGMKEDEPGFLKGFIEGVGQVLYDTFVANSGGPYPTGIGILFGAEPGAEVGGPAKSNAQANGRTTGAVVTGVVAAVGGARGSGARSAARATGNASKGAPGLANETGILRDAARGKGNFGLGSATAQDAARLGESWVGKGYTVASDGKTLISADGLRQFRPPSVKPRLGTTQANFEQRFQPTGQWQSNGHLDIVP